MLTDFDWARYYREVRERRWLQQRIERQYSDKPPPVRIPVVEQEHGDLTLAIIQARNLYNPRGW